MKERKEIWTVELCNITTGESLFDHRCNCLCDDLYGAIEVAEEIISEYVDYPGVVETTVYQGQYMTENGDVQVAKQKLQERIEERRNTFAGYKPEEVYKLDNASVIVQGNYAALIISDDNEGFEAEIRRIISEGAE